MQPRDKKQKRIKLVSSRVPEKQPATEPVVKKHKNWPELLGTALFNVEAFALKWLSVGDKKTDVETLEDELNADLMAKCIALGLNVLPYLEKHNPFNDAKIDELVKGIAKLREELKAIEEMRGAGNERTSARAQELTKDEGGG